MRYRRFGRSDLVVSEVGFGVWTLASDWWGVVEDKQGILTPRSTPASTSSTPRRSTAKAAFGEELLADVLKAQRDEIVLTTKCGYDIEAERKFPGQSERPLDWEPASIRLQLEDSLHRLGTDHIDLYQLHNTRIEPILDDDLWEELEKFRDEGKVRELGVALGPAIGWVDEGLEALRDRDIVSLQTVFNVLEQEPGRTFAAEPAVADGRVGLDLARAARVGHALGSHHARHGVPARGPPLAPQPRQHARQLRQGRDALVPVGGHGPHRRSGRDRRHPRRPRVHDRAPHLRDVEDVREYSAASDLPLTADEVARIDELWDANFGVTNRYEMPLKSSTRG